MIRFAVEVAKGALVVAFIVTVCVAFVDALPDPGPQTQTERLEK